MIFRFYKNLSFSTRLSGNITLITALIFIVAFIFIFDFSRDLVMQEANANARNLLSVTNLHVENVLAVVETSIDNMSDVIAANINDPDAMFAITRNFVVKNKRIVGSAIAFEPNYYKSKGVFFAPYSTDFNDIVRTFQLGNSNYDYHKMEWYAVPKRTKKAFWTDPYFDKGGANTMMTTFSKPLLDKNGNVYAIFTADVALDWLTTMVNSIRSYPGTYSFMLSRNGTYIIHPKTQRILNETIFSVGSKMSDTLVMEMGRNMIIGKEGKTIFMNDSTLSVSYYAPIKHIGWSLGIVIPYDEIFAANRELKRDVIVVTVIGLLLLLIISAKRIKKLVNPLERFSVAAKSIANGNFNTVLPEIKSRDEMWDLYQSFNLMQKSLTDYIDELRIITSNKERIESELRIANEIQMGMVPEIVTPFPMHEDIDLYAFLKPAKEVGGDLYDFFIEDNKLIFTVGDVSGKGVPASLFMAITCSLFRSVARRYSSPADIVKSINHSITETNNSNMFVTLFVGILDLDNNKLTYCNAGHNAPIIISKNDPAKYIDVDANIAVGVVEDYNFKSDCLAFEKNTTLLLYTDGVTEAENQANDLFGDERLLKSAKNICNSTAKEATEKILCDLDIHTENAEQNDDITLLIINYMCNESAK